jgi:hypothetical protein
MLSALVFGWALAACWPAAALHWTRPGMPTAPYRGTGPQLACMASKCSARINACLLNADCRTIMACSSKCRMDDPSCFFICEVTYGIDCVAYQDLADCIVDNGCIPRFEPDGKCRVGNADGLGTERDVDSIAGSWWVVRGLNPHYDSYACQHNNYVALPDGTWINNVSWLNTYHKPPVLVRALPVVTVDYPGVFLHNYTTLRQLENWVVVSRPRPNYILMLWCGWNKELEYAGGIVISPERDASHIPTEVNNEFRKVASRYGLDYDHQFFDNDNSRCDN